ncbi:MAG: DNA gyrase inhibitor YacG [Pseudomonadota bacterium]
MTCPVCGKPTEKSYRPFCSRRCANVDLGRWLNGSYAIPIEEEPGDEHTADAPERPH